MGSGLGVTLSIGGLCGLLGAVVGLGVQGRNAAQLHSIARAIPGQSGGATPEQIAQQAAILRKLRNGGRWTALLLVITVVCMAVARYL